MNIFNKILLNFFSRTLKKNTKFKDVHKGESCYIFGNGSSLKYYDLKLFNEKASILATNFSDAQVFFQIGGNNTFYMLNKLTHFDFREKNFKAMTAAQTLVARIDCNIYRLENHMLISCNRSFADYFEDRLIDAVNF